MMFRSLLAVGTLCASAALCVIAAPAVTAPASAPDGGASAAARSNEHRVGGDLFIGGPAVTVNQPVSGDLFAAGGSVDVDAAVAGDLIGMGGKVRVGADVGQSVYVAGGQLNVNGKVGRNMRVAGGQVELGPRSEVAGNLSVAGGQVRLHGAVRGHVQAAGGRLLIDGPVGGDVLATSGQVELGPNARIAGTLRYRSSDDLRQDPAAQVSGGIDKLLPALGRGSAPGSGAREGRPERPARDHGGSWVWTIGLMLLAAVVLAVLPGFSASVARTLRERPGASLGLGFVLLVSVPVGALVLMVTLVGIPLALLTVALYLALLPMAYVCAAIGLGDWALQKWRPAQAAQWRWRSAGAALALAVLALLAWLPMLGGLIAFAMLLAGLGALLLQAWRPGPAPA